jgi:hypothetical protein
LLEDQVFPQEIAVLRAKIAPNRARRRKIQHRTRGSWAGAPARGGLHPNEVPQRPKHGPAPAPRDPRRMAGRHSPCPTDGSIRSRSSALQTARSS